jgi:hypothetical protein
MELDKRELVKAGIFQERILIEFRQVASFEEPAFSGIA